MKPTTRRSLPPVLILLAAGGCYEEHPTAPQAQQAAQPPQATGAAPTPAPDGSLPGQTGGSHLAGAKRAAGNTADRINQRQEELEEALEDQP